MADTGVFQAAATEETPAAPRLTLGDLILLRLLPAKKSVPEKDLAADIALFYRRPPSALQMREAVADLKQAGFIRAVKGQAISAAGKDRALSLLGIAELPAKANWPLVKNRYLVPKALGVADANRQTLSTTNGLTAFLIKRQFQLPAGTPNSLPGAFAALACRMLGFPEHISLQSLIPAVISREMDLDPPLTAATLTTVGPLSLLKAPPGQSRIERLRAVALAGLANAEPPAAITPEEFDLESFANTVLSVARNCPTGRFGGNKVFISHVWKQLRAEPRFAALGLDGFKLRLLEALQEDRLHLSRADLVQFMDAADVRESETHYLQSTFHFILVEDRR